MNEASVGFQCPECVAEGRKSQRQALTTFGGSRAGQAGLVTRILIGLNIVAALIGLAVGGLPSLLPSGGFFTGVTAWTEFGAVTGPTLTTAAGGYYRGAFPELGTVLTGIDDGGVYRLFTAMFIHYGIVHLLMNMYTLWILGRQLEAEFGPIRYLTLYLLAGLGGGIAGLLIDPQAFGAGASTALFGLFGAFFVVGRRLRRDTSMITGLIAVNVLAGFFIPNVGWAGHLGGLVTGGLVAVAIAYAPRRNRTAVQVAGCLAVALLLAALTAFRVFVF
jgi:membrane associated rhomboid family serine protease